MSRTAGLAFLQTDAMVNEAGIAAPSLKQRTYPQYVKYMGSKSKIMEFVLTGLNEVHRGGQICDLFAGSASLAGAIGHQAPIHSNDIQNYSRVLSGAYLTAWRTESSPTVATLIERAAKIVRINREELGALHDYSKAVTLKRFQAIEDKEREHIDLEISRPWHLFLKYYSGTWWSAEQALWIDALREVAEGYSSDPSYDAILSSLMFAMATQAKAPDTMPSTVCEHRIINA